MSSSSSCDVCKAKAWKYKCPGCARRTCSLECSKAHKASSGCTGQRSKTHYIKLKEYTPNDMSSDYVFLEDIHRTADNASRENTRLTTSHRPHSIRHQHLLRACRATSTQLTFMPPGMHRHDINQSVYITKHKFLSWTVEIIFPDALTIPDSNRDKPVAVLEHRVKDTTPVKTLLTTVLSPHEGNALLLHQLAPYTAKQADQLFVYLKVEGRPANERVYREVGHGETVRDVLWGERVVEFPTFVVWLGPPEGVTVLPCRKSNTVVIHPDGVDAKRTGDAEVDDGEVGSPDEGMRDDPTLESDGASPPQAEPTPSPAAISNAFAADFGP
ncbi:uncharacterized protein EV422DRAFT_393443 [Fimicolochytrium jonesii]|uniref:uncharacterized protein n=1 Tax=Fimicolochytrium jonesii TaxID=1396493 RepID=UPI0022FECECD|nr:uncharacterized protein EV422DRAFT_393443 [Fimicolochytrium jonesii]KAI8823138.1 hypothetical protein EV422DRAFT_393443 [Fimicolochytrium jonesii]